MAKKRQASVSSLSFLDVMSCGFGAVILFYIVINFGTEATSHDFDSEVLSEITRVEELIDNETSRLIKLRNSLEETISKTITSKESAKKLIEKIQTLERERLKIERDKADQEENIDLLKSDLNELELELESQKSSGGLSLRSFVGQGNRQYLTGLNVGGQHILILIDSSASMLDKKIVNVIRRRMLPEDQRLQSPKWQRAVNTVDWILANLPNDANFQVVSFNTEARSVVSDNDKTWLQADRSATDGVIDALRQIIPQGGTSLHSPFAFAAQLSPAPENIFLIIDSLPTKGAWLSKETVIPSEERVRIFEDSIKKLPPLSTVNVILFPMEGDPMSTAKYWELAHNTGGTLLSPPEDWP